MPAPRSRPASGSLPWLRTRLNRRLRRLRGSGRPGRTLLAVALTFGVLLATLAVLGHNLGARDGIRYINGGKIFLERGAMWYHAPGLGGFELAPQNIGGQANLRNNDVALFEPRLRSMARMEVDLTLAEGAYALIALDHGAEGTFTALRLSALPDPDSPFDNALVRFEGGRQVSHQPLTGPGPRLEPGEHAVVLEDTAPGLRVTLDGHATAFDLHLDALDPAPGVGSGELDVTLTRWRVAGTDHRGQPLDWEEDWSLGSYLRGRVAGWWLSALLLWLLVYAVPVGLVALATRRAPGRVLTDATLRPTPRWVYATLCLVPWMPLLPHLALVANHALLVGWGLVEQLLARGRARPLPGHGPRWATVGFGLGAMAVGAALLALHVSTRRAPLGAEVPSPTGRVLATNAASGELALGRPRTLSVEPRPAGPVTVEVEVELAEGEVVRLDLLARLPPDTDLFQVDRMSLFPSEGEAGAGQERFGHDFGGVSVLLSAAEGLPSETLRAEGFGVERSALAWTLEPGRHAVQVAASLPIVQVAVDGEIRELRDDLAGVFASDDGGWGRVDGAEALAPLGAIQAHAWSSRVTHVGPIVVREPARDAASAAHAALARAAIPGALGALLVALGGFVAAAGLVTRGAAPRAWAAPVALRFVGGHAVLVGVLGLWLVEAIGSGPGTLGLPMRGALVLGGGLAGLSVSVLLRAEKAPWVLALALGAAHCTATVEAGAWLWPAWRHRVTTWWNHDLSPEHWWAYDPMLRRLNPWYIDMRFQRRPWSIDRPDGRTRIAVFGGSQTYGWGIPSRDRMTFSDRLQVELREDGHDVEVLNAAFPGVKTTTGLRWFEGNLLRYRPDVVVVNFVVNEFMDVDTYGVWAGRHGADDRVAPLTALALLRRLPADVRQRHVVQIVLAHRYAVLEMEASLRRFVQVARSHGIDVVFSVEPTNLYVESGGAEIMRHDEDAGAAMRVYARLGEELSVPVYDGLETLSRAPTDLLFFDTMHLSRHGHAVFAEGMADLIAREALPPVAPAGREAASADEAPSAAPSSPEAP